MSSSGLRKRSCTSSLRLPRLATGIIGDLSVLAFQVHFSQGVGVNGEVAEWSIAAVLKTAGPKGPGGSNPSLSANLLGANVGTDARILRNYALAAARRKRSFIAAAIPSFPGAHSKFKRA